MYICLIPKKIDTRKVGDYLLASPLVFIRSLLVFYQTGSRKCFPQSLYQSAFVEGRQILDSSLISNEIIEEWHRKNIQGVNVQKALDKVDWDYLDEMMRIKGFGHCWQKWIRGCVFSTNFSFIINSKPRAKFKATRGIRQGDLSHHSSLLWSWSLLVEF